MKTSEILIIDTEHDLNSYNKQKPRCRKLEELDVFELNLIVAYSKTLLEQKKIDDNVLPF